MPYDDHVRNLLNSRSAPLASFQSPAYTAADTFSMESPHPRESPSLSNWSESPSCYSQSRISVDDTASETSATSGYYGREIDQDSELCMSSVLLKHHGSSTTLGKSADSVYRDSSKTVTSEKAAKERRFLGGGWGRTSTDTRPSMDSFKKSMESYPGAPISPRAGSFSDQMRVTARTPSLFSTSSGASSGQGGAQLSSGARPGLGMKLSSGLSINSYNMDSRATSPAPSGSPTAPSFIHPYANLDLLPPGHESLTGLPSRSNSDATLSASTVSPNITPSSSASSASSPSQETFASSKKEKRRPPEISVSPLNRAFVTLGAAKSPSALSTTFSLMSPTSHTSPVNDDTPAGMLGFPGSPACNLISLEQAQMKARERSKSAASDTVNTPPRRKELTTKKSKPTFVGIGGGFASTISGGSPSPLWNPDDGRARTVSAGSALHGRSKGYTSTSNLATQSTVSVNIIQGGGIENIPEAAASKSSGLSGSTTNSVTGTAPIDATPSRTLKPKRSGFLKFFKDMSGSTSNTGNPNISAPSTPIHIAHNTMESLPPVPKVPAQFQSKSSTLPDERTLREKVPPPVVVSSPASRSLERSQSVSDDSHTSIGDHTAAPTARDKYSRSNTEPVRRSDKSAAQDESFGGLKLRPLSAAFNGLPEDYLLSSPRVGSGVRGSSEARSSDDYGIEERSMLSPATPSFPMSARSVYTHGSSASSGSDAFSSLIDPRTPSSFGGFPPGVPRTSTDSQSSAAVIASLREQLRAVRQASTIRINELENQVQELRSELQGVRCDHCGRRASEDRKSVEPGIVNRPRARTGGGSRSIFGVQ
ncbi:hypothetical protein FRC07_011222 [Ceratobasidium sp. 392]|nr:hypothetical protein FRC07_011222 [Ceratobasidium sp. 392]